MVRKAKTTAAATKQAKKVTEVIHPHSRKATQLTRKIKRAVKKTVIRSKNDEKKRPLVERCQWFKDDLKDTKEVCISEGMVAEMTVRFLERNRESYDAALAANSARGGQRPKAAQEEALRSVIEAEKHLIESGMEIPDVMAKKGLKDLLAWDGSYDSMPSLPKFTINQKFITKHTQ
eukprot:TRINITY_DN5149_c0_g1_i1.p1 TRINITY_DN5149_c0_g1~~TRINITY_DN5149_c0_g1_i1.p1  ORF type:complete len:176 (-),score=22.80 TRINITY_DN5149_c0_g1_i1:58-585(-)